MQSTGIDPAQLATVVSQLTSIVAAHTEPSITFGALFNLYFQKHVKKRNRAPENAEYFYRRHGSKFAEIPVCQLNRFDLQDWADTVTDERGPAGAKRAVDMMSAVINWGLKRGYVNLQSNPCKGVDCQPQKSRGRFLRPQEFASLAEALNDEPALWRDFVWLALFTGARKSNLLSMRWEDIDFDLAHWHIPETKNGNDLFIALTTPALHLLKRRFAEAEPSNPWVFPGEGSSGHVADTKRMWQRICKKAGITDLHIHDLRRTLASYMAIQGASPYQIGKALGHLDPRSTAVYARLDLTGVRGELEKVHSKWLVDCLKELPMPEPNSILLIEQSAKSTEPTPAESKHEFANIDIEVKVDAALQVLVEARIIIAMQQGATTKKQFHSRIGAQFKVNARELNRILNEMIARGIISTFREGDLKRWQSVQYKLNQQ